MSASAPKPNKLGNLQSLGILTGPECEFLSSHPQIDSFSTTVTGVSSAIRALAYGVIQGQLPEDGYMLVDKTGALVKFHEKRMLQAWAPRNFALQGTLLEYTGGSKGNGRTNVLNITPECFCVESSLKDADRKQAFTLVTPKKILQLGCASFGDKILWVASISRAIYVPRKKSPGLSMSSLFRGTLSMAVGESVSEDLKTKLASDEVLACDMAKWTPALIKPPAKRFVVLQCHFLRLYKDEQSYSKGARPIGYVFLDHSTKVIKRSETALEIRPESNPAAPAAILELGSPEKCLAFKDAIEASLGDLRSKLQLFLAYFSEKPRMLPPPVPSGKPRPGSGSTKVIIPPPVEDPPPLVVIAPPVEDPPPPTAFDEDVHPAPPVDDPVDGNRSKELDGIATPRQAQDVSKDQPQEDEEKDPRPIVRLVARWVDSKGSLTGRKEDTLGTIRVDLNEYLVCVRDEIFSQVPLDLLPPRFAFLRSPDALRSQLLPGVGASVVTSVQEDEIKLSECLRAEDGALVLSCAEELVMRTDGDWDTERKAYKQMIMHLEAQLAEARRMLNEKARLLKRGEGDALERSHLFQALAALQRDGFLEASMDLEDVEHRYLCVFAEEDAIKAFAGSPNTPLRTVWRRLCNDPERMRRYIEDLERFVLRPFKIRKERLGSPFWAGQVLRDIRFVDDSTKFEEWAKQEPWCEDDAERYVYLTSKLFYSSESKEEFSILTRGVPSEPPPSKSKKKEEEVQENSTAAKPTMSRPASFMNTPDALEAMKRFQQRKSSKRGIHQAQEEEKESAPLVPAKIAAPSLMPSNTATSGASSKEIVDESSKANQRNEPVTILASTTSSDVKEAAEKTTGSIVAQTSVEGANATVDAGKDITPAERSSEEAREVSTNVATTETGGALQSPEEIVTKGAPVLPPGKPTTRGSGRAQDVDSGESSTGPSKLPTQSNRTTGDEDDIL